jgi:hypothetical protein
MNCGGSQAHDGKVLPDLDSVVSLPRDGVLGSHDHITLTLVALETVSTYTPLITAPDSSLQKLDYIFNI